MDLLKHVKISEFPTDNCVTNFDAEYCEINDRMQRSRNIIVYKVPESLTQVPKEQKNHDELHLSHMLFKLNIQCREVKTFCIDRPTTKPRPIVFPNTNIASGLFPCSIIIISLLLIRVL